MKHRTIGQTLWIVAWILAITTGTLPGQEARETHVATSSGQMVASVSPLATAAGLEAFRRGGNAVDAAIATALTLGVVDSYNSGIGGGCFVLVRTSDGQFHVIDGREMAPQAASRDMFLRAGQADGSLSQHGPLAVGTPGAVAAYAEAVAKFGVLAWPDLVRPAAELAERGFSVTPAMARLLRANQAWLAKFGGAHGGLLSQDGQAYRPEEIMRQPELAATYRALAEHGPDWFYRGEFAQRIDAWFRENGGLLTAADLAAYRTVPREPLVTSYRGFTVVGVPPPSSGGVHVAQMLNILETFDLAKLQAQDPALVSHVIAEAMKLAFADRAFWLGDPDFADVPFGLVNKDYARQLAQKIRLDAVLRPVEHGDPRTFDPRMFEKHTTHIATADAAGNWVALTTTVNTSFGSKVVVPGTGVVLNNQMDDFSISPGEPNAYGLIGADANAIEPGKRPLSSMSPTIIVRDGQPILTVGAAGGPKIITQVLLAIVRSLDLGYSPERAVVEPRFHHQFAPDSLFYESGLPAAQLERLTTLGHRLRAEDSGGVCQLIAFDPVTRQFVGVADPRAGGSAAGLPKMGK